MPVKSTATQDTSPEGSSYPSSRSPHPVSTTELTNQMPKKIQWESRQALRCRSSNAWVFQTQRELSLPIRSDRLNQSRLIATHTGDQLVVTSWNTRSRNRPSWDGDLQPCQNHSDGLHSVQLWCPTRHQRCLWYSASRPRRSTAAAGAGCRCTNTARLIATTSLRHWMLSREDATRSPRQRPQHQAMITARPMAPHGHPVGARKNLNSLKSSGAQYAQLMRHLTPKAEANHFSHMW